MNFSQVSRIHNWADAELGDLVKFASGGTPNRETDAFWGGDLPWVTAKDLKVFELSSALQSLSDEGASHAKIAPKDALLVLVRGMTLFKDFPVAILTREMSFNQDIKALIPNDKIDPHFLGQQLTAKKRWVMRLVDSAGHGTGRLDTDQLKALPVRYPSLPEQKKIAAFLGVVDAKITALQKRQAGLERYKRGLMQALFSQTLRFTKDDGTAFPDWERRNLSFYLSEPKARNRDLTFTKEDVLSVSGDVGCVNQIEHLGRSYAGVSVKDYHIVRTGDVVYTKSPLRQNPYGTIKANFGRDGIVSTLYAVYRPTKNADVSFIHHYFSLDDNLNRYLRPIVRKGAKNDMKVNNTDVLGDPVFFPTPTNKPKSLRCSLRWTPKSRRWAIRSPRWKPLKKGFCSRCLFKGL